LSDNSTLDPGTGGDTLRDKDRAGVKTQIVGLDLGIGTGTESLMAGVMPVSDNSGSLTVDNAGTFAVQIAANSSVNVAQVAGTTTDTNSGVKSAGTQRVVLATDQPQLTNALKVDGSAVTQPVSGTVTANLGTAAVTNAGTFAVQDSEKIADNAGFTDGTTKVNPVGYILDETPGTALTENDIAAARVDSKRAQVLTLEDATTRGQRAAVSAAGRVSVDASGVAVPITDNSGSLTVDAPVGTPAFVRLSDGSAAITALPITDNSGSLTVDAPVGTPVFSTPTPSATGGWSKIKYAAQTTTVQTPKGTAATFGGYYIYNPNASVAYLQVFDAATATTITLGTTVPDMIFAIPAASAANIEITCGVNMTNGVKLACTTTATGSTAPGTGLDMTIFYK
jgi:hypothetical protein